MRCRLGLLAVIGLVLVAAGVAQAVSYDFTCSDPSGPVGCGTLSAVDQGNGSFLATSGTFTVEGTSDLSAIEGTYSLIPVGPGGQAAVGHLAGGEDLIGDNLLFPANKSQYLDNDGLLFGQTGTAYLLGINVWGNGNTDYAIYAGDSASLVTSQGGGATFTLTAAPVPEPITMLTGLMVVSGIGAYVRRRTRVAKA